MKKIKLIVFKFTVNGIPYEYEFKRYSNNLTEVIEELKEEYPNCETIRLYGEFDI